MQVTSGNGTSPGRAFLRGILAGLGTALAGLVVGYLLQKTAWANWEWAPLLGAPLGAAVAAWTTAFCRSHSAGSATGLAFFAILLTFFFNFLLEYTWVFNLTMSPYLGAGSSETMKDDLQSSLWDFLLLASILGPCFGAVLGLLFGRPKTLGGV